MYSFRNEDFLILHKKKQQQKINLKVDDKIFEITNQSQMQ